MKTFSPLARGVQPLGSSFRESIRKFELVLSMNRGCCRNSIPIDRSAFIELWRNESAQPFFAVELNPNGRIDPQESLRPQDKSGKLCYLRSPTRGRDSLADTLGGHFHAQQGH